MPIHGLISYFSSSRIKGWAKYTAAPGSDAEPVGLVLNFNDMQPISPSKTKTRTSDGATEFEFFLPAELQSLNWNIFVEKFGNVVAFCITNPKERSGLPFDKSIFRAFDPDNRTTLLAERRREYSILPKPNGRLAAFTIVYNEYKMLPLWIKYYSQIVGLENTFVLDQGSDFPYSDLPSGVTIIRLPRESFDNWLIVRLVATFQRHLLESYDSVLYADSDEFLCVDPSILNGQTLRSFLLSIPEPVGITCGFNVIHDIFREQPIDFSQPILPQRRYIMRATSMDKPMIARIPLNWVPGFHEAREGGVHVPGMYMMHLRWYDLDQALLKGNNYRKSKWDPYDIERQMASYQRDDEKEIVSLFKARSERCSMLESNKFDKDQELTVLPPWVNDAIQI